MVYHFLDRPLSLQYAVNMQARSDQASKQLLRAFLQDDGTFTSELEVSPDPQNADGYFVPNAHRSSPVVATLLGRMTKHACSLELFSSAPDVIDVGECIRKHLNLHILRKKQGDAGLPRQWIICAGKPSTAFEAYGVRRTKGWPRGVHSLPSGLATSIVVVNELPEERSTLLLRLMGRGRTLRRAVSELKALSDEDFELCIALPILVRYRIEAAAEPVSPADEEFVMNTQEIMDRFQREAEQRGERRGELRGRRNTILHLLRRKFGELPPNITARIQAANADMLEKLEDKLLFASSLEDVFAP